MRIKSMRVENFRSIRRATLEFDDLTALVGANGAGKSAFLRALLVFQGRQEPDEEDFYNRDTSKDIRIAVTFTGLPGEARERFARYLRGGDLEVTRVYKHSGAGAAAGSSLRGTCRRNPAFDAVRRAHSSVAALDEYDRLCGMPEYSSLPRRAAGGAARRALDEWEDANPGRCDRPADDGGSFFGFEGDADGNLGRFIKILYVSDVHEDHGGGGRARSARLLVSTIWDIMNGAARSRDMQRGVDAAYDRAPLAGGPTSMRQMDDDISAVLGTLARGARVEHERGMLAPGLKMLSTTIRLAEDGYTTTADRVGAGLQRAFTMAMTGHMHGNRSGAGPTIVLAIEEPELHQHPARARHIAGLLSSISRSGLAGVAADVQVVYTTHSPHLVGADRMGQIRLIRKGGGGDGLPGTTRVWSTTMDDIKERLRNAGVSRHADLSKLERDFDRILTPLMGEGFFARTAVLVEGESDRVAILKTAEMLGTPLNERGVAVIPCGNKAGILGPLAMFMSLGVRTYPVWDRDGHEGKEKRLNDRLLSLVGRGGGGGDCLDATTAGYSCLGGKLEGALRSDMGAGLYDRLVAGYTKEYSLGKKDRKPLVTHLLMEEMEKREIRPARLGRIVGAILADGGGEEGGPA